MTDPTRLVLVTGHEFGIRAFEGLFASVPYLEGRLRVPLLIGLPESRAKATVGYAPIAPLATAQGVAHVDAEDGSLLALAQVIRECRPHYLLVIGWSRLVHDDVLSIPADGCIGMHPTRLPEGRGQAPIPWTIIKGLRETSLSVFALEPEADTGPVIAQYDLAVHARETAASLFHRVAATHFTAGQELADQLARRRVTSRPQLAEESTRWPKRRPEDGRIEHSMSSAEIDRLVRGQLGPYPRAFVSIGGVEYPVHEVVEVHPAEDATHEEVSDGVVRFGCRDGVFRLRIRTG